METADPYGTHVANVKNGIKKRKKIPEGVFNKSNKKWFCVNCKRALYKRAVFFFKLIL